MLLFLFSRKKTLRKNDIREENYYLNEMSPMSEIVEI